MECFLTQKNVSFRASIKYFESAPPKLGRLGDGKRNNFLSPALVSLSYEFFRKGVSNQTIVYLFQCLTQCERNTKQLLHIKSRDLFNREPKTQRNKHKSN